MELRTGDQKRGHFTLKRKFKNSNTLTNTCTTFNLQAVSLQHKLFRQSSFLRYAILINSLLSSFLYKSCKTHTFEVIIIPNHL